MTTSRVPVEGKTICVSVYDVFEIGAIQVFRNAFSRECDPHPPPRNANNVEPYTVVTLFSGKADTHPPRTALRNTWMSPYRIIINLKHITHCSNHYTQTHELRNTS